MSSSPKSNLVFEKEEVPASTSKPSLLGALLEVDVKQERSADPEALVKEGKKIKAKKVIQKFALIDEGPMPSYADPEDDNLPYHCRVWFTTRSNVSVSMTEECNSTQLMLEVLTACLEDPTTIEDLVISCVLLAADRDGKLDDDCPYLSPQRAIHRSGLHNLLIYPRNAHDEKLLANIKPKTTQVYIGPKKKALLSDPTTKFLHAAEAGDLALSKRLLGSGLVKVTDKGIENWTALHYAARSGKYIIVLFLIRNGANLDAKSKKDWTPLHLACYQGHYEIADILLQSGADPDVKDKEGKTPQARAREKGFTDIADLFHEDFINY
ncbi:hypothetical protein AAMO2058_000275900 [Amorphochlora amoebiformis]